jgi:hypothetical protein
MIVLFGYMRYMGMVSFKSVSNPPSSSYIIIKISTCGGNVEIYSISNDGYSYIMVSSSSGAISITKR